MKKRILVVEDFDDIRMMMSIMLQHSGYEVLEAADGAEALEKVIEGDPDVVLMDIGLPVLNGIEAAKEIRRRPGRAELPIIAVTAYGKFYEEQALKAGCNAVVSKPVEFGPLRSLISDHLADDKEPGNIGLS